MFISDLIFYLFSIIGVFSALYVVAAKNPVHSVLFLILCFFTTSGLFLMIGAEYLAMTLVIVYVGAVAVLLLFVVMMLNINYVQLRQGFVKNLPIAIIVGVVMLAEIILVINSSMSVSGFESAKVVSEMENTRALGGVIYTKYFIPFQLSGLVLLVAMIGAIVLTLRKREGVLRQNVSKQISRKRSESIEIVKVDVGKGA